MTQPAPAVGAVLLVYDGDLVAWVRCEVESVGPAPAPLRGAWAELVVLRPLDAVIEPRSGLPTRYAIPWPAGASMVREADV